MNQVQRHYEQHLGPIYSWMVGGLDNALYRGAREVDEIDNTEGKGRLVVDLGAGFGMHAIPFAERGYTVVAIDNCSILLHELKENAKGLAIKTVKDDVMSFPQHLPHKANIVLCMTDTLTHLATEKDVVELTGMVYGYLASGGRFVTTFRDYSKPLTGTQRFIPVRSTADRIFSCFLEYGDRHVTVNDILYEWNGDEWESSISAYQKLRVSPEWFIKILEDAGFTVVSELTTTGMVRVVADRP